MSTKELLKNEDEDKIFRDYYYKHENKIKEDYRKKIIEIQKYYDEISENTKFSGLEKKDLVTKV